MTEVKHTPGPWAPQQDRRRFNPHFVQSEKAHVADVLPCGINKRDDPEAAANARLIAASPDLYDFATNVAACDDSLLLSANLNSLRATIREWRDDARAALAKVAAS